jgi:hypothetical protein
VPAEHQIHFLVVGFGEGVCHHLAWEAHADSHGIRPCPGQDPVVKSLASPQPVAPEVKGQPRTEEHVDFRNIDDGQMGLRFQNAEGPGAQVFHGAPNDPEVELITTHRRENPGALRMSAGQFC